MQLHTGPFFLLLPLFSSRCQSLGMLDIKAGMMLTQTQHTGKSFLPINAELEKKQRL